MSFELIILGSFESFALDYFKGPREVAFFYSFFSSSYLASTSSFFSSYFVTIYSYFATDWSFFFYSSIIFFFSSSSFFLFSSIFSNFFFSSSIYFSFSFPYLFAFSYSSLILLYYLSYSILDKVNAFSNSSCSYLLILFLSDSTSNDIAIACSSSFS